MKLHTLIERFNTNNCEILYDGSWYTDTTKPFAQSLHRAYFDSLLLFQNRIKPFDITIEYATITKRGIAIHATSALTIDETIAMINRNHWAYKLEHQYQTCGKALLRTLTIWPDDGPIELTIT